MTQPPSPSAAALLRSHPEHLILAIAGTVPGGYDRGRACLALDAIADYIAAQAMAAAQATANLGWHDATGEWHAGPTGPNEDIAGAAERAKPAASDKSEAAAIYKRIGSSSPITEHIEAWAAALAERGRQEREIAAAFCNERGAWAAEKIETASERRGAMWANYANACEDCAEVIRAGENLHKPRAAIRNQGDKP